MGRWTCRQSTNPIAELRAYEAIFKQLDPQGEGEINVTKCDHQTNLDVVVIVGSRSFGIDCCVAGL
jgi:hypothetical protein